MIKSLSEGPDIKIEDSRFDIVLMLLRDNSFLGRIHAAHRGAVFMHLVPASYALNKSNLLWYLPIGRPHNYACRRACSGKNPFKFNARDNIRIYTIPEFLPLTRIIRVKAARYNNASNPDYLFLRPFKVIYGLRLAEFFANLTSKASPAIQAPFRLPLRLLLGKGLVDLLEACSLGHR